MEVADSRVVRPTTRVSSSNAGACLIAIDSGGIVRRWMKDAELVFGYASEHAEGQPIERFAPFVTDSTGAFEGWCRRNDGSAFRGFGASLSPPQTRRRHAIPVLV